MQCRRSPRFTSCSTSRAAAADVRARLAGADGRAGGEDDPLAVRAAARGRAGPDAALRVGGRRPVPGAGHAAADRLVGPADAGAVHRVSDRRRVGRRPAGRQAIGASAVGSKASEAAVRRPRGRRTGRRRSRRGSSSTSRSSRAARRRTQDGAGAAPGEVDAAAARVAGEAAPDVRRPIGFDAGGEHSSARPSRSSLPGGRRGALAVASSLTQALSSLRHLQATIAWVTAGVVVIAVIAFRFVSNLIARPVRQLVDGTRRVAERRVRRADRRQPPRRAGRAGGELQRDGDRAAAARPGEEHVRQVRRPQGRRGLDSGA